MEVLVGARLSPLEQGLAHAPIANKTATFLVKTGSLHLRAVPSSLVGNNYW
jgi:hypothetical protein